MFETLPNATSTISGQRKIPLQKFGMKKFGGIAF